ncbi:anhydro-N-acetylmuramic acid kinase [soil metagenome]
MLPTKPTPEFFIGLMSGTSLDGVDGVLARFPSDGKSASVAAYLPFPEQLRADLIALQNPGDNEIHREAMVAQDLARCYAKCVLELLAQAKVSAREVRAIAAHGQTIRHRPELGYTRQTNNPALLAELSSIDVIADFRSRDIAAGGQGAPLVPAFHQSVFGKMNETRVIVNIGGISNISVLRGDGTVIGFDTGPGNVLMDTWIAQHKNVAYDEDGAWAASGTVYPALLGTLRDEAFFSMPAPKSTGRDLFHTDWLANKLAEFPDMAPADVQATLAEFTATAVADAIAEYASEAAAVYVCGGGALNGHLMQRLQQALVDRNLKAGVYSTDAIGIPPNQVEALAFAWLAYRHVEHQAGNIPAVTGARGARILGALYPA